MLISTYSKQIISYAVFVLLSISITACGGGGSSSGNNPDDESPKAISGKAQKGSFLKDSEAVANQLDSKAVHATGIVNTKIVDDFGSFTVTPTWSDWTEVSVTGRFFNEDVGANSATELTLNSIVAAGTEASNVNLFTHFVAARIRQLLATDETGLTLEQARTQAQDDLKKELGLSSSNIEKLDISDGIGDLKNDNAILLLFSGGFMSNNGNATSLLALSDDFANNGKIDDVGLVFFQGVANYVGTKSNLTKLSNNLKQIGIENPPSSEDLTVLPSWANQPPLVTITPKGQTIIEGVSQRMDATISIDPEGSELTFSWSGDGTEDCGSANFCELNNLSVGIHQITLTARDSGLSSASDTASIIVVEAEDSNTAPNAILEPSPHTVKQGLPAVFDASRSVDADEDILTYAWSGPGTENCGNKVICSVNGLVKGKYFITVTVSDNKGGVGSTFSQLTVSDPNVPPVANAGSDTTISNDRNVELSGSGTDSDGTVNSYEWRQGDVSIGNSADITISGLAVGVHEYTLIVTDNDGATASDTINVTVTNIANSAPVANAGDDKSITQGQSVFLFGSGTDLDGTIESYQWFEGDELLGETADLVVPGLSVGTHQITLVVTDNNGGNDSDVVTVTVNSLNVTVDVSSVGCIVRLQGRHFLVSLTLQGGETGTGTSIVQEYAEAGCTGEKLGGEFSLPTTYTITNIETLVTDNSKTTADMTVTNLAGTEVRQVFIVDGNVVLPTSG